MGWKEFKEEFEQEKAKERAKIEAKKQKKMDQKGNNSTMESNGEGCFQFLLFTGYYLPFLLLCLLIVVFLGYVGFSLIKAFVLGLF